MIELIALVAVCGAAYLGIRKPTGTQVDRVDPRLWPYIHY